MIELDTLEVPEGVPSAEPETENEDAEAEIPAAEDDENETEEMIDITFASTPESLPQTGVAGSFTFFAIGMALVGFGAFVTRKCTGKEED